MVESTKFEARKLPILYPLPQFPDKYYNRFPTNGTKLVIVSRLFLGKNSRVNSHQHWRGGWQI